MVIEEDLTKIIQCSSLVNKYNERRRKQMTKKLNMRFRNDFVKSGGWRIHSSCQDIVN